MNTRLTKALNAPFHAAAVCIALLVGASTANALTLSVEFNIANSSFANPVTVYSPNDLRHDLTPGDIIALDIVVGNPTTDLITAVFASLVYDTANLVYLGGAFNNILTEDSCLGMLCSPETLTPTRSAPASKPANPFSLGSGTTDWLQAVAHANVTGAAGTGPDVAAIVAFQYTGPGGFDRVDFVAALTPGDAIVGAVGPTYLNSAYINLPEPGTALLLGLGLLALARTRRS